MPMGIFYITAMSLFNKISFNNKDRDIEKQDNMR